MASTEVTVGVAPPSAPVSWEAELRGAQMLLKSGLLPASIKSAEAAVYLILTGRDMGLSPVQSLRSINIIGGKPEVAADMQLALFKSRGGRAVFTELTERQAVLQLTHPNGDSHTETFTMEAARGAGLTGDNWKKYPKAMLRSRAITAGLKSVGFDVLAGVYAEGEIGGPETTAVVEPETVVIADGTTGLQVNTETGEVVPSTPSLTQAGFVMPFGKSKGTPLTAMATEVLTGALQWARDKGKFEEFQEQAAFELDQRRAPVASFDQMPTALEARLTAAFGPPPAPVTPPEPPSGVCEEDDQC